YTRMAERLQAAAEQTNITGSENLAEVLESLRDGHDPDGEIVERLLNDGGDGLGKKLRNDLRTMVRPRTRNSADFLIGLASLAIDLLHPRHSELEAGTQLRVTLAPSARERGNKLHEAASIFQAIY